MKRRDNGREEEKKTARKRSRTTWPEKEKEGVENNRSEK